MFSNHQVKHWERVMKVFENKFPVVAIHGLILKMRGVNMV